MSNFPTSLPSYTITASSEHLGDTSGGLGISGLLNAFEGDITALATKMGTGAATPTVNKVLVGTGTGTSSWATSLSGLTLTAPVLSGSVTGTYTLAGTPTITSPTITSPTVSNPVLNGTITGTGYSLATMSDPNKFSTYLTAASNTGNNAFALVPFDTKVFDTGTNLDIVTNKGRFTAPIAGFYHFTATVRSSQSSGGHRLIVSLYKNGAEFSRGTDVSGVGGTLFFNGSTVSDLLQLAATDFVEAFVYGDSALALDVSVAAVYNRFSGFLVSKT